MPGVSKDEVKEYLSKGKGTPLQRRLAELRLEYSDIGSLKTTFLKSLRGKERIHPTILPTQASGRWSYINPPLSNFPKKCINPSCPKGIHAKTEECWSIRDCIIPDPGTFWIEHDLDAVEHRIYCLILHWKERLDDLRAGMDIHTPVTCTLFNLPTPRNLFNPHTSIEDIEWRRQIYWGGKDDGRRTIGKNMTYGGQYFYVRLIRNGERTRLPYRIYKGLWYNPSFVYTIPNIQSFKIVNLKGEEVVPNFEELAVRFVESTIDIQKRKAYLMERYRKDKISRTLYGGPRYAYFQNQETAKYLFNHTIQGTVASYIDESCILLQKRFPESYLVHNQHDSLKWAFSYNGKLSQREEEEEILRECKKICQRTLLVGEYDIPITATFKIVRGR